MTLTTEQLRERIGHLKERLRDMKQHKYPDNCPNAAAYLESLKVERQQDIELLEELLANREAQPVAWRHDNGPFAGMAITRAKSVADSWIAKGWTVTPLYTAPPAPAVPVEIRNAYRAEGLAEVLKDAREYAPLTAEQWGTLVKNWHQTFIGLSGDANACRAAMLAQPVSGGYKFPEGFKLMPLEMTDEIGEAIAMEARCCGGIALCIYEAALAAAPEDGNGA